MIVRRAKDMTDVARMVALGAEMHKESIYADRPYIPAKLASYARQFIEDPMSGVCVLAEDDDECHGMMAGWRLDSFFNDDACAKDMILYTRKDKRRGTTAMRLVAEFERWARETGVRYIDITVTAGIDNDKATRFYTALGYRTRGACLMKEF
jgi:GNAT superfamily N-acetyltransferase